MQVKGDVDPITGERPLIIGTSDQGQVAQLRKLSTYQLQHHK